MDMMSMNQAFETMLAFLQQFQDRGPFEDSGVLLAKLYEVNPTKRDDEGTDLWQEWCFCTQQTLQFSGSPNTFPILELARLPLERQKVSLDTSVTILQAYLTTYLFLARQYYAIKDEVEAKEKVSGVFYLMSNMDLGTRMQLGFSEYVVPADPAYWGDWMRSVQHVLLPDTQENQQLVSDLISHPENFLGKGSWGEDWYARLLPDGRQLWAEVYDGRFQCAGIRHTPIAFDPYEGLSTPLHP